MNTAIPVIPPLVALGMRPLPLLPLQPILAAIIHSVVKRHPDIFDRLGEHADKSYGLNPTDLPFAFILKPQSGNPSVKAVRTLPECLDVRISGPLAGLMGLLDGSYDGDALFFSRDILIEGDMEATLALRNAVDDAQIDLVGEITARLGPLSNPAESIVRKLKDNLMSFGRA
ncbi:SCP2 sterol-binding domain-containing protein [Microvirga sp. W0021]|uniref:SCP2 sterol-binding domain-containing protein n=1 Tax=Hohaiivirga grylli TaxID=3133970 RepID=A0ABV0BJT4_9HYPH